MKFSEKLIQLRKEKLLSQEELGEKLNVTRQTVSKWELGQTTPDMEKLVEMSKLFGVSLDELTSESELNTDNPIKEKNHTTRNVIIIVILVLVLLGCVAFATTKFIGGFFTGFFNTANKIKKQQGAIFNQASSALNIQQGDIINQAGSLQGQILDQINKGFDDFDEFEEDSKKDSFNWDFEMYKGTKYGSSVRSLIDNIITNNQKNERKVTAKYNDTETLDPTELRAMKRNFDDNFAQFEVYFEYDEDGYIYEAFIEKI